MLNKINTTICTAIIVSLLLTGCQTHTNEGMFSSLSSAKTHINFRNDLQKRKAFGILYYLYYYNGGGVSVADINNDGLPDIYTIFLHSRKILNNIPPG